MDLWIPTSLVLAAASALGAHRRATRAVRDHEPREWGEEGLLVLLTGSAILLRHERRR